MIPFWGINLTQNKKNEQVNGRELVIATVKQPVDTDALQDKADALEQKSQLPVGWRVLKMICGFAAAILIVVVLRAAAEIGFEQAYANGAWLIWLGVACAIVYVVLTVWSKKRYKKVIDSDEVLLFEAQVEAQENAAYGELGVPENAPRVDVFGFQYKEKNGKVVARSAALFDFVNICTRMYVKDGELCIADTDSVYAFPIDSLRGIQTVKKQARFTGWHKILPPTHESFKPYRVVVDQYGVIVCKPYYILEAEIRGETWGLYFPGHELPVIEQLTGLRAERKGDKE